MGEIMATKLKDFSNKYGETKDHQQELTDKIIARLEEAATNLDKGLDWEKPWFSCSELPFNPVTGTKYKGINVISTLSSGFDDPRFYTYNNIQELNKQDGTSLHIKKGAKGTPIFKAVQVSFSDKKSGDEEAQTEDGSGVKTFWKMAYAGTVFNGSQIEGLEPYIKRNNQVEPTLAVQELTQALIERTGLKVEHSEVGRAYFQPSANKVHMPLPEKFKSSSHYMDTLLHEFGHATGPALGRDMSGDKNSASYAKEELVAELSSIFMSAELGIPHDSKSHENHAAYMKSWLLALKNDKNFIFSAAQKASKATEYQMGHLEAYRIEHSLKPDVQVDVQARLKQMKPPVLEAPKISSLTM